MIGCLLELKPLEKIKTLLIALLSLTLSLSPPPMFAGSTLSLFVEVGSHYLA